MPDTNYYNDKHKIVRILFKANSYDFHLGSNFSYVPNPKKHYILLLTLENVIDNNGLEPRRLELLPGINDEQGNLAEISLGMAFLIDKNQTLSTTNLQNGSTGFSIENANLYDLDVIDGSITPQRTKDYTNNDSEQSDPNSDNIGIFWNNQVVMIKSRGGSITLGDEGVHLGGNIFWESSTHSKDIMIDNSFHSLIPQTIPTALITMPQIPNFAKFVQIANAGQKFLSIVEKTSKATKIIDSMGKL